MRTTLISLGLILGFLLMGWLWQFRDQYHVHAILSGSMRPTIAEGSLVLDRALPPNQYHVGDVVTFYIPGHGRNLVTHRIRQVQHDGRGMDRLITQGDANTNGDGWIIFPGAVTGKVIAHVPFLGYVWAGLHSVGGFVLTSLLSLICIACIFYKICWQPSRVSA